MKSFVAKLLPNSPGQEDVLINFYIIRQLLLLSEISEAGRNIRRPSGIWRWRLIVDTISGLPGHVLDQILSKLPIRDAVRTSILSSRWKFKWSTIPRLIFDSQCVSISSRDQDQTPHNALVRIVDHVLLLHHAPVLDFKLSHKDLFGISDIDKWIRHLSRNAIRELVLEIWKGNRYLIPSSLFDCQFLENLELYNCLIKPRLLLKNLRSLKRLNLQQVTLAQDDFEKLIASSPLLEKLTLMSFDGFTHLNIDSPSLHFLCVGGAFHDINFKNALNLVEVSMGLYANIKHDLNRAYGKSGNLWKFLSTLPRVQKLEVNGHFLKHLAFGLIHSKLPNPSVHLNYLSLHINFTNLDEILTSLCILRSSPNLQVLQVLASSNEQAVTPSGSNLRDEDHCRDISSQFSYLRLVKIFGISGLRSEMSFISFLLLASPALEKMTIEPFYFASKGLDLIKELLRCRRTSVKAEIIYLDQ